MPRIIDDGRRAARRLRIYQIKGTLPRVRHRFKDESGEWQLHFLAISDCDTWEMVKAAPKGPRGLQIKSRRESLEPHF